jgi:tetratricopeptide (TPR) repeat protein
MTDSASDASARLARLEGYLADDPENDTIAADLFDTALSAGRADDAARMLARSVQRSISETPGWQGRKLRWLLATRRLDDAESLVTALMDVHGPHPALVHDFAWTAFVAGDYSECVARLAAAVAPPDGTPDPIGALYVRALHRLDRIDEACDWAEPRLRGNTLGAVSASAASLAALDAGRLTLSLALADAALARDGGLVEALVSRGSLALAARSPETALPLLERAVALSPDDGRAWSALGFAHLEANRPQIALQALERAVMTMTDHVGTWIGLGWTRQMLGNLAAARLAFERAVALDRNFSESLGSLAAVLALQGERAAALEHIERALRLDRNTLSARYAQAVLDGSTTDARAIDRLARRLLSGRPTPLGDGTADAWLPPVAESDDSTRTTND